MRIPKNSLVGLLCCGLLWLAACSTAAPAQIPAATPETPASHEDLARRYAPVIYHGTASDQDFITAVDFDGDWIGNNNWENQPEGDLSATLYYSVIETETHYYLFYAVFHPRDYTADPCEESEGCHENDMEALEVVVARDGSAFGRPVALLTLAHDEIHLYAYDDSVGKGALKVEGKVKEEEGHPIVYVETFGHGIYGRPQILSPGKAIYRVGESAEVPETIKDEDVRYRLVPIYETLWQHRDEVGPGRLFDQPFDYRGRVLPAAFDGVDWGEDRANPPWGYNQEIGNTLLRGDFFLDPAKAVSYFADLAGEPSQKYLYNPFLDDLKLR